MIADHKTIKRGDAHLTSKKHHREVPAYVNRVLTRLKGLRASGNGWEAKCPCPEHNSGSDHPGDQHPSLRIDVGHDGRILLTCRVGCRTERVLGATGLEWRDLFPREYDVPADAPSSEPTPVVAAISSELLDAAYSCALAGLILLPEHAADLRRRGLDDGEIDRRKYRSLRDVDRRTVAQAVHEQHGDAVLGVPGFLRDQRGLKLVGSGAGLLIPVRNLAGQIVALKVRRTSAPKYVYLSGGGSATCKSQVHVPLGVTPPCAEVRVTEGELKADVCMALASTPTISVPGVTQWRLALPVLEAVEARSVVVSFDAPDLRSKQPVRQQAYAFVQSLKEQGFEVEMEVWDECAERN